MIRFDGLRALVTGGTDGIGLATAKLVASLGGEVVVSGRDERRGAAAAAAANARYVRMDVGDAKSVDRAMAEIGERDVLIHSAGLLARGDVTAIEPADFENVIRVNLTGFFLVARRALPGMIARRRGSIVAIASYLGLHAGAGMTPAYNASKGGLISLVRTLAVRHGGDGVRVNAVCPAFVPTALNRDVIDDAPDPDAKRRELAARNPLNRLGTPEDIANAAAFLASDASAWTTGVALVVDGGQTAR